jgi:hypothetical protein
MPLNGDEDMADKTTVTHCTKCGFSVVIPDSVPDDAIFECTTCKQRFGSVGEAKARALNPGNFELQRTLS